MKQTVILKNAAVIKEDASILTAQDLLIEDGRIAQIGNAGTLPVKPEETAAADVIDCSSYVVTPGIPNLHVHTAMNIFKGIAEDVDSNSWFNEMIWPYESKMTQEDIYIGTKLGIAEMINNGVTVAADHYFGEEQVLKAALEMGMRFDMAPTIFGTAPDYRERIAQVGEFIRSHQGVSDRIFLRFGPHSNYTCPGDTLAEIVQAAKSMGLPVHLHLSEEEAQVTAARERTGKTPFAAAAEAGCFETGTLVAHGLWIEESDLPLLSEDTWFAFCLKTYMKLASGRGGFFDLYDQLHFSFGTDGAASSNTLSPVEQARLFALVEKFECNDACIQPAAQVWRQLMNGHRAFSFGTGVIRAGAPADLVIWDLWTPDTGMYYDPVSAILYSSNSSNVRYTMVAGEFLKYDGRLKEDMDELFRCARELQKQLLERGRGQAKVFY